MSGPDSLQKEAGLSHEAPEQKFQKTVETSRQALNALAEMAINQGENAQQFTHLGDVVTSESHILLPPMETMRRELAKVQGGETDRTKRTRALCLQKTGQVFVPEELADNTHDILHESIHRATWLHDRAQGLNENQTLLSAQLASRYGVTITEEGEISPDSEYIQRFATNEEQKQALIGYFTQQLEEEVFRIKEGLTEWATQKAGGLKTQEGDAVLINEEDFVHQGFVNDIRRIKAELVQKEGISEEKAEAILVSASLTGNIERLLPYFDTVR